MKVHYKKWLLRETKGEFTYFIVKSHTKNSKYTSEVPQGDL